MAWIKSRYILTPSGIRPSLCRLATTRPSNHIPSPCPSSSTLYPDQPRMPLNHLDGLGPLPRSIRKCFRITMMVMEKISSRRLGLQNKPLHTQPHTLSPPPLDSTWPPHSTPHQSISPSSLPFPLPVLSLLASASILPQCMPQRHDRIDATAP